MLATYMLVTCLVAANTVMAKRDYSSLSKMDGEAYHVVRDWLKQDSAKTCQQRLEHYRHSTMTGLAPPSKLEADVEKEFTMGGLIPMSHYMVDDSGRGTGTHYKFARKSLEAMIENTRRLVEDPSPLPPTMRWFIDAVKSIDLKDKTVLNFGSTDPWQETVFLVRGARKVVAVDYNQLTYDHPQLETTTPDKFPEEKFDVVASLSSFDHDGLGRYGDPISVNADLEAMQLMRCVTKDEGVSLFSVPVGPDQVVYNLHRRYGRKRLPMMLRGWHVRDAFGWDGAKMEAAASVRQSYEPVLVMEKTELRDHVDLGSGHEEL